MFAKNFGKISPYYGRYESTSMSENRYIGGFIKNIPYFKLIFFGVDSVKCFIFAEMTDMT